MTAHNEAMKIVLLSCLLVVDLLTVLVCTQILRTPGTECVPVRYGVFVVDTKRGAGVLALLLK